jgi:hypothetical protein
MKASRDHPLPERAPPHLSKKTGKVREVKAAEFSLVLFFELVGLERSFIFD